MVARDTPTSALNVQEGGDHYKNLKIQPVEFIEANGIPFLEGCVIKRMCRHGSKAKAEDLRKAIHEITLLLATDGSLHAIDEELKTVTASIMKMLEELAE